MNIELRPLVGIYYDEHGQKKTIAWDVDQLIVDGRQIATINRLEGAPIGLLSGAHLSPSQIEEVKQFIAAHRGGHPPQSIDEAVEPPTDEEEELDE